MKDSTFMADYASIYDVVYASKPYADEAKFIAGLISEFTSSATHPARVLDLACGSGNHAVELATAGYRVTGADPSEAMLALARRKAAARGLQIDLYRESFQTSDRIPGCYDTVLANFSAINYLVEIDDLRRTLDNICLRLAPGGTFIFDMWNGLTVLADHEQERIRTFTSDGWNITRRSSTKVDPITQEATVTFHFTVEDPRSNVRDFFEEHRLRFFLPREMRDLLVVCGFRVLLVCPFLRRNDALSASDWHVTFVATPANRNPCSAKGS